MFKAKRRQGLLKKFNNNEDGNLALTFGLTFTVIVGLVGAATDFSSLSAAYSKSQSIADSTALAAAVFIKDHDRPPTNDAEGYRNGVTYSAADIGHDYNSSVDGGAENVSVRVVYDDNAKEATVTVNGETRPNFTQIFGKERLPFEAKSVVSYLEAEDSFPASISLVLDNSGSMRWDDMLARSNGRSPDGAAPRIAGLRTSVNTFSRELRERLGLSQSNGQRIVRMSMLPYAGNVVNRARVPMRFGYISPGQVREMRPEGATNSNPPMRDALEEMITEDTAHRREAERVGEAFVEPLKFVVFMSDGQNTVGRQEFIPDSTSPFWWDFRPISGEYENPLPMRTARNMHQGFYRRVSDRLTIDNCNQLKDLGTEIFTIGYALEVGEYNANTRRSRETREVTQQSQSNAFALLSSCASGPENFVRADDNEQLEAAFDTIQNAIVEELIRIKS